MQTTLEWKIRLKLWSGNVLVGGYVGSQDGHVYVADEFSGEIHDVAHADIEDFDVRKY